jgi:hypothetical protein
VLLSLEPEELAGILLPIFRDRQRTGQPLNFYNYLNEFFQREPVYPREYADRVSRAIMEWIGWMTSAGILALDTQQQGHWMFITRRGLEHLFCSDPKYLFLKR